MQMNARERTLALLVGAIAAILVNLALFQFFTTHRSRLSEDLLTKTAQLKGLQALYTEKSLWEQRGAWVAANQPKLTNQNMASSKLLDDVREAARKQTVLIENPVIGAPERKPQYVSVPLNIDTKSSWPALVAFLREMQAPDAFLVFESATVQVDAADKTQMRGKFRIAKWFAPQ